MKIILITLSILSALILPIIWGVMEAWYYHLRMKFYDDEVFPTNRVEKTYLNIMRVIFYLLIIGVLGYFKLWLLGIGLTLQFSLIHDGVYYVMRHRWNKRLYPRGFWDFGNDAPEGIDLTSKERIWIALIGVILIVAQWWV